MLSVSEVYKRMKVENVYKAIQKVRDVAEQSSTYNKGERLVNREHHTKKREDPKAMDA